MNNAPSNWGRSFKIFGLVILLAVLCLPIALLDMLAAPFLAAADWASARYHELTDDGASDAVCADHD